MNETVAGVLATMLTPFTDSGDVEYRALDHLIEWYVKNRVAGLFANCKSSESFELTAEERL